MSIFVKILIGLFILIGGMDICLILATGKLKHDEFWEGYDEVNE